MVAFIQSAHSPSSSMDTPMAAPYHAGCLPTIRFSVLPKDTSTYGQNRRRWDRTTNPVISGRPALPPSHIYYYWKLLEIIISSDRAYWLHLKLLLKLLTSAGLSQKQWCIFKYSSSVVVLCVPLVGSTCCSYAGRHTTCREYCQAIFRTDSTPTVSQINAVKEYCQSHSAQLLSCVSNFTKSYPIRSPIDSKSIHTSYCWHSSTAFYRNTGFISQTPMCSLLYY